MTFADLTSFAALDVPVADPTGRAMVLVVVKGTFDLQGNRLERQAPVRVADVPSDPDADDSSVRWPSDLSLAATIRHQWAACGGCEDPGREDAFQGHREQCISLGELGQ